MKKFKRILKIIGLMLFSFSSLLVLIVMLFYFYMLYVAFFEEPYLGMKAQKLIAEQAREAGPDVKLIRWAKFDSIRVQTLLIDNTYIFVQVNPNLIGNDTKLLILHVIDEHGSEECIDHSTRKGVISAWSDHRGLYKKTDLNFSSIADIKNHLSNIKSLVRSLPETKNSDNNFILYNCTFRSI